MAKKSSISKHSRQLLGYSIHRVKEIADVLEAHQPTEREIRNRNTGSEIAARYLAARAILMAGEGNASFMQQLWDREDGKVADVLLSVDGNKLIDQLEAGRQRVLASYQPQQLVVEGETVDVDKTTVASSPIDTDTSK
jgi:hypothetical protein